MPGGPNAAAAELGDRRCSRVVAVCRKVSWEDGRRSDAMYSASTHDLMRLVLVSRVSLL